MGSRPFNHSIPFPLYSQPLYSQTIETPAPGQRHQHHHQQPRHHPQQTNQLQLGPPTMLAAHLPVCKPAPTQTPLHIQPTTHTAQDLPLQQQLPPPTVLAAHPPVCHPVATPAPHTAIHPTPPSPPLLVPFSSPLFPPDTPSKPTTPQPFNNPARTSILDQQQHHPHLQQHVQTCNPPLPLPGQPSPLPQPSVIPFFSYLFPPDPRQQQPHQFLHPHAQTKPPRGPHPMRQFKSPTTFLARCTPKLPPIPASLFTTVAAASPPPYVSANITVRRAGPGGESDPALLESNPSGRSGGQFSIQRTLRLPKLCPNTYPYMFPSHPVATSFLTLSSPVLPITDVHGSLLGLPNFLWDPGRVYSSVSEGDVAVVPPLDSPNTSSGP